MFESSILFWRQIHLVASPTSRRLVRTKNVRIAAFLCFLVVFHLSFQVVQAERLPGMSGILPHSDAATTTAPTHQSTNVNQSDAIRVIFSDVDGTLVHYPDDTSNLADDILKLPPSATGMQGIISSDTLQKCQTLRRRRDAKLVLISGMRTSTLWKRLPYLPLADAYCSEAGGRIFYPVPLLSADGSGSSYDGPVFTPEPYRGAQESDLVPFGLIEDTDWRRRMERVEAAGADGYVGNELADQAKSPIPWSNRKGLLWDFCRQLDDLGFVMDTKGYSVCFRVNRKQQTRVSEDKFEALLVGKIQHPPGLATSTNLGCVDFYPKDSGKKNCCLYLAKKFCNNDSDSVLSEHAMCICDDDNDLEMALACHHAFIPGVSSSSMEQVISQHPEQFTVTGGSGDVHGTAATEQALERVLERMTISSPSASKSFY